MSSAELAAARVITVLLLLAGSDAAQARPAPAAAAEAPVPAILRGADIVENLGAQVPRDLAFVDQEGRRVELGRYLGHGRPVLLTLVYFHCPMLCSLVMNGALRALRSTGWVLGRDFDAVTVSFDPAEGPAAAAAQRRRWLQVLGRGAGAGGVAAPDSWPFLTGPQASIRALTDVVGFRYNFDRSSGQFAHAAGIFVLTPAGKVARYLYGVDFAPRDLRLALVEAGQGKSGPTVDRVLFQCFRWSPASRRYELFIRTWFRVGGLLIFLALGSALFALWRRDVRAGRLGTLPSTRVSSR